jgi:CMP-N,N'-diacetyllegionaminic acid synthase
MLKLSDLIIYASEPLRGALQRMTQNRRGVLFVCDEDGHLVGVVSDGDVRRSLLDDTLLISPIHKVMNTDPISASTIEEARYLLQRMNIVAVPVLDQEGRIREAVIENDDSVLVLLGEASDAGSEIIVETGALALIPARGGSKRIPRKNLANVAGKSLLAWTIQAATNAERVSHVLISTDDSEIADAARALAVDVPWLRPAALSTDTTPTLDVILHALEWAVQKLTPVPEIAVLLEPTAPLRRGEQIDEAISLLMNSDADCVAAVSRLPHVFHPEEVLIAENGLLQPYLRDHTMDSRRLRNEQGSAYVLNGLVYAFRIQSVLSGKGLFGSKTIPMFTRWEDFLDIDTPEDLELANFKIGRCLATHSQR